MFPYKEANSMYKRVENRNKKWNKESDQQRKRNDRNGSVFTNFFSGIKFKIKEKIKTSKGRGVLPEIECN